MSLILKKKVMLKSSTFEKLGQLTEKKIKQKFEPTNAYEHLEKSATHIWDQK